MRHSRTKRTPAEHAARAVIDRVHRLAYVHARTADHPLVAEPFGWQCVCAICRELGFTA